MCGGGIVKPESRRDETALSALDVNQQRMCIKGGLYVVTALHMKTVTRAP